MAKFFGWRFLPKSLQHFCFCRQEESGEILRKVEILRDFRVFSAAFDKNLPYPLRQFPYSVSWLPYAVGRRNKGISQQPYCIGAQKGGMDCSLPFVRGFVGFVGGGKREFY